MTLEKYKTAVTINDINLTIASAWSLSVVRGTEPSKVSFTIPDSKLGETEFDKIKNAVTIKLTAPDSRGNPRTLELKDWYITSCVPHSEGMWTLELQDRRWKCRELTLTADYNVSIASFEFFELDRQNSLNGGAPWTCYDACVDAFKKFGLTFEESKDYDQKLKTIKLPFNLGNSIGGGFVGMRWEDAIPILLYNINSDPVILPNGKITLVDRKTNVTDDLDKYGMYAGQIGSKQIQWAKPKKVRILFERRVERYFDIEDFDITSSGGDDIGADNVMPRIDANNQIAGWETVEFGGKRIANVRGADIRRNWLKDVIVRVDGFAGALTAKQIADRNQLNYNLKRYYRKAFRPNIFAGAEDANFINIKVGHIGQDGQTVSDQCVYMPYERVELYAGAKANSLSEILEQFVSTPVLFFLQRPAPFTPQPVIDEKTGDLIIVLNDNNNGRVIDTPPGMLTESLRYGTVLDIVDPNYSLKTYKVGSLRQNWQCWIFYHALLIGPRPDLGFDDRLHSVEKDMFADGQVEVVEFFVNDMTANYALDRTGTKEGQTPATLPLILLNSPAIDERAESIKEQFTQNFAAGNVGIAHTSGFEAILDGDFWVSGNIYSMMIMGGTKKSYSIVCQWLAAVEVRDVLTEEDKLAVRGKPAQRLG